MEYNKINNPTYIYKFTKISLHIKMQVGKPSGITVQGLEQVKREVLQTEIFFVYNNLNEILTF